MSFIIIKDGIVYTNRLMRKANGVVWIDHERLVVTGNLKTGIFIPLSLRGYNFPFLIENLDSVQADTGAGTYLLGVSFTLQGDCCEYRELENPTKDGKPVFTYTMQSIMPGSTYVRAETTDLEHALTAALLCGASVQEALGAVDHLLPDARANNGVVHWSRRELANMIRKNAQAALDEHNAK